MHLETQNKWKNKGPLNSDRKKKSGLHLSLSSPVPGCLSPCQMPDAGTHCGWRLSCPSPEPCSLSLPGPLPTSPHTARPQLRGKQRGSRVHGLSPASSQGCDAELAPPPLPSPGLFPVRARIPTPQARPESWQPAPSPEGELPAQNSPVLASTNPNWIPLPPTLDLVAS